MVKRFVTYLAEKKADLMYQRMPGAPLRTVKGWVNPSLRELKAAIDQDDELRFIIDDKTGDLYVWDAAEAIHAQVASGMLGVPLARNGMSSSEAGYGLGMISYGANNPVSISFLDNTMSKPVGSSKKYLRTSRALKALAASDEVKIFHV